MSYEVELKFAVKNLNDVTSRLLDLQASERPETIESDTYFAHPARDFARTDEAFRLRRVAERNVITYKGPKLDPLTKTRREIEISLGDGSEVERQFHELLKALGFQPVATVHKRRGHRILTWEQRSIHVTLDEVDGVGTYVELECLADDEDLDSARAAILSLAKHLGLAENERRSYLELLLTKGSSS